MWSVIVDTEVDKFIDGLELPAQSKSLSVLKLLGEYGPLIREPHSKKISGYRNLFELRTSGRSPIRMFYTVVNQKFYILHAITKKTDKTPIREINTALKRLAAIDTSK